MGLFMDGNLLTFAASNWPECDSVDPPRQVSRTDSRPTRESLIRGPRDTRLSA